MVFPGGRIIAEDVRVRAVSRFVILTSSVEDSLPRIGGFSVFAELVWGSFFHVGKRVPEQDGTCVVLFNTYFKVGKPPRVVLD